MKRRLSENSEVSAEWPVELESPWGLSLGEANVETFGDLVAAAVLLSCIAPFIVLLTREPVGQCSG